MNHSSSEESQVVDALREALERERAEHMRAEEMGEAALQESVERRRTAHREARKEAVEELGEAGEIEEDRVLNMRQHRSDLDAEATVAHEVALRLLSGLGEEYSIGKTTAQSLFRAPALPRSVAAKRAGIPSARVTSDPVLKVLKYAGMAGCQLLGTFGMGSLLLRVQPKALLTSPMLLVASGLGALLVAGSYLTVVPASKRHGTLAASAPNAPGTKRSFWTVCALVAGAACTVALVDAKALASLDGARALVDPASVPPFGVTLLVAGALSATYVLGSSLLAFADGFAEEAESLLEAEAEKHAEAWLKARRGDPEVRQAVEALNYAATVEGRRHDLDREIETADGRLRNSLEAAMGTTSHHTPEDEAARAALREHGLKARVAELKLAAYGRHGSPRRRRSEESAQGGAR